ncbi:DUF2007 domain-containing protein [Adhaeribacter sp. BT258]|uniref:DUF2007 domain-containing protein n=1 Tax=Adhaeribacter terrigena TaxID=2793070 RepID=A0ABS1C2Z3_9BACT|nr:DUF2007 domain-containing protein [Adhaeribacter terrigena]MBK0403688.1 DUF2007 domain-containing protein [Adhaeribacter terrigena]
MQDELVTLLKYLMPMEAHILKGRLESEGVPAYVIGENFSNIYPFAAQLTGGVELKVAATHLERAQEILADKPRLSEEE